MVNDNPCRALIVDDDELMRNLLTGLLPEMGAEVVGEAKDGVEALAAFDELRPDITFLDIKMPVKDGTEALRDIIASDPDAIVVMLSAISDIDVAETCREAGARHYIRKGTAPPILKIMLQAGLDLAK